MGCQLVSNPEFVAAKCLTFFRFPQLLAGSRVHIARHHCRLDLFRIHRPSLSRLRSLPKYRLDRC